MKMYDAKGTKVWGIALETDQMGYVIPTVSVAAVDGSTGDTICYLMTFEPTGEVVTDSGAFDVLKDEGYDPYQHNNKFDEEGRIIVQKDEL